jgi:hypothetical protein
MEIDGCIPYKDNNLCEIIRATFLWTIWNERNMIIFQNKVHSSIRLIGNKIIALVKHWCKIKGEGYMDTIHLILPTNVDLLPVQITRVS